MPKARVFRGEAKVASLLVVLTVLMLQSGPELGVDSAEAATVRSSRALASTFPCPLSSAQPNTSQPGIGCPAPPSTFDVTPYLGAKGTTPPPNPGGLGPAIDAWAWSTFAALNWPAKADTTQPSGYLRGIPDTSAQFATASSDAVLVWETFKEKREVFNDNPGNWQIVGFPPSQSPGGQLPMCPGADMTLLAGQPPRLFAQSSKLTPAVSQQATLDETAEVASPAQESMATLCAGYSGSALAQCQTMFPDSNINGRPPVGPRVWKGSPTQQQPQPVYYEVKLNYDYFDYVVSNGFNDDATAYNAARTKVNPQGPSGDTGGDINLPYRTSLVYSAPGEVTGYEAARQAILYQQYNQPSYGGENPYELPGLGSMQLKAGWILLSQSDDASQYHTTPALYFSPDAASPTDLCYNVGQFGLVGLHIIQRVHMAQQTAQGPGKSPIGGAYIFATWEHNSVESPGFQYANFLTTATTPSMPYPDYLNTGQAIPVQRASQNPILPTTQSVTGNVWSQLPAGSVWKNYMLVGTQFLPVSSQADSITYNQPYLLANLVVETNAGLQNFMGLPPNVAVIGHWTANVSGFQSTTTAPPTFQPTYKNVSFGQQAMDMGGCMGCHGVAQLNGYAFSFVLQDGQRGTVIDTEQSFTIPPLPPSPSNQPP